MRKKECGFYAPYSTRWLMTMGMRARESGQCAAVAGRPKGVDRMTDGGLRRVCLVQLLCRKMKMSLSRRIGFLGAAVRWSRDAHLFLVGCPLHTMSSQDKEDDYSPYVCVGLPIELWAEIVGMCAGNRHSVAALAATCRALRAPAMRLVAKRLAAARASIDAAMDEWQEWGEGWDDIWTSGPECSLCTDEDSGESGPVQLARWVCDDGVPGHSWSYTVLCDNCADAVRRGPHARCVEWRMRRVHIDRPHVWSTIEWDRMFLAYLPTDRIGDGRFAVPPALVHAIDPLGAATIKSRDNWEMQVSFSNFAWAPMPSMRSWMPVSTMRLVQYQDQSRRCQGLLVCCDLDSAMWGTVAAVDYALDYGGLWWEFVDRPLDDLLALYAARPASLALADLALWVTTSLLKPPAKWTGMARCDPAKHHSVPKLLTWPG
ncbi:hypothetical protein TW95_gp1350 [Pandoravirus inopinatum]|uniref:Uncharacterized protein n=1 Tax=Pandoravirus inopinatum TaxID=1605721 RepID=A0A0B5J3A8_9VIRU|nr:hypothetical protein TW95_gp1350 [Pandoravirus inopinatum]AJF98084.1 hypothetical protein [Pandoravirus inopinatum]